MKTCSVCEVLKDESDFYGHKSVKNGLRAECKKCTNSYNNSYKKANKEKVRQAMMVYSKNNPVKYQSTPSTRAWGRNYMREKRKDSTFRILDNLRKKVYYALKGERKTASTRELIGCSFEYLVSHLEAMFDENMSWENYGKYWQVDHRRPCASFDLSDPEQQRQCFNYTNLQPLERMENFKKGTKYNKEAGW